MRSVWWLAAALLVAGCSDHPPAPDDDVPSDVFGAIQGVVVSEGIVPIAEAAVLLNSGLEAMSDAQGVFRFDDLEPGLYTMRIEATGYHTIQATADVSAGKLAKPRIVLPIDASPQPFHLTTAFDGYVEFADGWVTWVLQDYTGNTELCTCEFDFSVGEAAEELILEAFWDPSSPANDNEFWVEIYNSEGSYVQGNYYGNPIWHRESLADWEPGDGRIQFTVGTTVQFQQEFQAFATVFYNDAAPDGWSINS